MTHDQLNERVISNERRIEPLQPSQSAMQARLAMLARVSAELVGLIDGDHAISAIVGLAVPALADACSIQIEGTNAVRAEPEAAAPDEALEQEALLFPLTIDAHRIGTLRLARLAPRRRFTHDEIALASELAGCAARALDGALRHGRAQAAIRARDEVLGMVAHDLRNPLNGIRLAAECIAQSPPADPDMDDRAWADVIARAAARADHLIADLLDLNRLDAGALVLQHTELPVRELLSQSRSCFTKAAEAAGVKLEFIADDEHAALRVDEKRMLQVLSNLIDNAIKFTPPGGRVRVAARSRCREICFSVSDTGPGIAPDDCRRVFEKFWQRERGGHAGGTGLGLYIAKAIVEAHGGQIGVDGALGHGTTFEVSIPIAPPRVKQCAVHDAA